MTATITEDVVQTNTTDTPEDAAHIVLLPKELRSATTPQAYVTNARVNGVEIEALCGYRWVPQKDPLPLPLCQTCKDIFEHDPNGFGDRDRLPDA